MGPAGRYRPVNPLQCKCQGEDCDDVVFDDGAFDGLGDDGDILAVGGDFLRVLGSQKRETLLSPENPFRVGGRG